MSHSHEVKKIKNADVKLADNSAGSVTVVNVSQNNVSLGKPAVLLFPGDSALSCADNPQIDKFVSLKFIKIVDKTEAKQEQTTKPKKQKVEEVQVQETFETVAEVEPLPSVQLNSSSDDESLNSEAL